MTVEELYHCFLTTKDLNQEEYVNKIQKWRRNMIQILSDYYERYYPILHRTFNLVQPTQSPSTIETKENKRKKSHFRWTSEHHAAFLDALYRFGREGIKLLFMFSFQRRFQIRFRIFCCVVVLLVLSKLNIFLCSRHFFNSSICWFRSDRASSQISSFQVATLSSKISS